MPNPEDEERRLSRSQHLEVETVLEHIKKNPHIQAFLKYHQRREAKPRRACGKCQFEYAISEEHVCPVLPEQLLHGTVDQDAREPVGSEHNPDPHDMRNT